MVECEKMERFQRKNIVGIMKRLLPGKKPARSANGVYAGGRLTFGRKQEVGNSSPT